uniref:Ankyrin repeat domain 2 n=1 Tax=Vombatus ursinus TaxID=29139 RepID=A0A4X2LE89_VOMUR
MGNCVGRQRRERPASPGHPRKRAGRNEPLKKERPKWKSDYPMTDGQLRSKRDEFWDTAPAFEGRKEIWDALKAAAFAVEANDHELAQAILDGASITLPHGSLSECYDELGNRYQLPVYCLAPPVNLLLERSEDDGVEPPEPAPSTRREFPLKKLHNASSMKPGPMKMDLLVLEDEKNHGAQKLALQKVKGQERVRKTSLDLRREIIDVGGIQNLIELRKKRKQKKREALTLAPEPPPEPQEIVRESGGLGEERHSEGR